MIIKWKTGRPEKNGEYVVIVASEYPYVWTIPFTTKYGWNSYTNSGEHAFPDEDILLWTEPFANEAIDKYGQA